MTLSLGLTFVTLAGIVGSALLAFWWAARDGQFSQVGDGARVVFTPEEPEGVITDTFPNPDDIHES